MKKNQNLCDIALLSVFLIIIYASFVINLILPEREYSKSEKRELYRIGGVSFENDIAPSLEKVLCDQFFLRDELRMLKRSFSENILFIKDTDNYREYDESIAKIYYPIEKERIDAAADYINRIYGRFLQKKSDNVYLSVIPSKSEYTDLPSISSRDIAPLLCKKSAFVKIIDIKDSLSLSSYYKTDIHWRCEELYDAAEKLCASMGSTPIYKSEVNIEYVGDFCGFLTLESLIKTECEPLFLLSSPIIDSLSVKYRDKESGVYEKELFFRADDKYDIFMRGEVLDKSLGNNIIIISNEKALSDRRLIIFRDSFSRSLAPLLSKNYREIVLIDVRTPFALLTKGDILSCLEKINSSYDILFLLSIDMLATTSLK